MVITVRANTIGNVSDKWENIIPCKRKKQMMG